MIVVKSHSISKSAFIYEPIKQRQMLRLQNFCCFWSLNILRILFRFVFCFWRKKTQWNMVPKTHSRIGNMTFIHKTRDIDITMQNAEQMESKVTEWTIKLNKIMWCMLLWSLSLISVHFLSFVSGVCVSVCVCVLVGFLHLYPSFGFSTKLISSLYIQSRNVMPFFH